jgi:hypothetical protein
VHRQRRDDRAALSTDYRFDVLPRWPLAEISDVPA